MADRDRITDTINKHVSDFVTGEKRSLEPLLEFVRSLDPKALEPKASCPPASHNPHTPFLVSMHGWSRSLFVCTVHTLVGDCACVS